MWSGFNRWVSANSPGEQKFLSVSFCLSFLSGVVHWTVCVIVSFKVLSEHTHIVMCNNTHTHTHVVFYGLRGLSIGVMVFILYKLYVLLPYTYPTPKLSPHRRRCIYIFPQKNSLSMIYKRFKLWGH